MAKRKTIQNRQMSCLTSNRGWAIGPFPRSSSQVKLVPGGVKVLTNDGYIFKDAISGPDSLLYWFFFNRLPETKYGKSIPKDMKEDEALFIKANAHLSTATSPGNIIRPDVMEKWHFRRVFFLGGAAHKPNPIGVQGGNNAIESAASLVNMLREKRDSRGGSLDNISDKEIEEFFPRVWSIRHERAKTFVKRAHQTLSPMAEEKALLSKILMCLGSLDGLAADIDRMVTIYRPAGWDRQASHSKPS
ncbi:hypothetical protein KVR01_010803 [Diaporthe batatas]|uniref:uncharacterized protein n=1 Tax=Diaporthe batatas TaxID=748121 RepID=UPI001D036EF1|nr:uncharacterized protein KVR01_010803 [Diaporthe batatas]KAG8159142.1 hypothetical protein KVR01_010803 [Diaporthe batatas]